MLAVVLMWALNNVLMKVAVDVLPPLPFVLGRFVIVMLLVWVWIAWRSMPGRIQSSLFPISMATGIMTAVALIRGAN